MKKTLALFLALMILASLLTSCSFVTIQEGTITGDVKQQNDDVLTPDDEQIIDDGTQDEPDEPLEIEEQETETQVLSVPDLVSEIGAVMSEGGEYKDNAYIFAEAVMNDDTVLVAEYVCGSPDYYSFLENVEIQGFEIFPFEFSREKISQIEENTDSYYNSYDCYFVDFDVVKGDGEYFNEGSNIYLMAFGQDPIAGGILSEFVPYDKAMGRIFTVWKGDLEYETYFVREFISLYRGELFEGKNYPSEFDFTSCVHLVTHLMSRSGIYRDYPPYSLDEINEFLAMSFEGNEGLKFDGDREIENWTIGASYLVTDEDRENGRLYGCALAHGGTTAEHYFDSIETEDENTKIVTVTVYADYAHFAKSKQLVFTIGKNEKGLPKMLFALMQNDTSRPVAYVSV